MGCPTVRGCIVRYPYVSPPYYGALFVGDGVSLPIPPQFGCDECISDPLTVGHSTDIVASFEALDEAEHIGVDTQDWD